MMHYTFQEAIEAEEQGRDAGYAVGELLRIINQQKAEIRDLKRKLIDEQKSVEKIAMKYFKQAEELERLKLEIEILIRKKEALRDEIAEKDAEIERLKAEVRDTDNILYSLDRPLVEIKIEAYRVFAERVKQISKEVTVPYIADTAIQEHKTGMFYYGKEDFDKLLKELTEKNDKNL